MFKRALHTANHLRRLVLQPGYSEGIQWAQSLMRTSPANLERRQLKRLCGLLPEFQRAGLIDAANYKEFSTNPGLATWQSSPVLTRAKLLQLLPQLKERMKNRAGAYLKSSGGSTGEPVTYLRDALVDALGDGSTSVIQRIAGCTPGMQRIGLSGSNQDIQLSRMATNRLRSSLTKTTLIGGFTPTLAHFRQYREAILEHPSCTVYGFTSLLVSCAEALIEHGWEIKPGHIGAAWAYAEMFLPEHRAVLKEAFGIDFRNFYGSRECSSIAMECQHGVLHVSPRYLLDVADPDSHYPLPDAEIGALMVTDLFNGATPMLRYEIGDMASLGYSTCNCGRQGRVITNLGGRVGGRIPLASGRFASALFFNHLLKDYPAVKQFQLHHLDETSFELHYSGDALSPDDATRITELTRRVLEQADVQLVFAEQLERSSSGKLLQYRDLRQAAGSA